MCGIVGCAGLPAAIGGDADTDTDIAGDTPAAGGRVLSMLMHGLGKLEYRGYDSAGVALLDDDSDVRMTKRAGEIEALSTAIETEGFAARVADSPVGIGHTRWSTHGPPTDSNAHPHVDCEGDVAVVHNGIIENYQTLRDELEAAGHAFASETDTEVVPHLIEDRLAAGVAPERAVREAVGRLEGSYALVIVLAGEDRLFAAREDSPLVLGVGEGATFLASDVPAFRAFTDQVVYLDDGEFAVLTPESWRVTDATGTTVEKSVDRVAWDPEDTGKSGYEHFMLKEIHEQPRALRRCLQGRVSEVRGDVSLDLADAVAPASRPADAGVQFVACGTSYHAALYGAALLRERGIPATAHYAHEYALSPAPVGEDLIVGVTQSGETADTLAALRAARRRGATTLAVTNTVGSTAARECADALYVRAGPEIGVAATKTFASQLVALALYAMADAPDRAAISALRDLSGDIQTILDDTEARAVAEAYHQAEAYFFIGRGLAHSAALEGALKFKEITYEHAEGFAAGELKHGTLALVTEDTPVIAIVTGDGEPARKTIGNVKEVEARDAPVIAVTDGAAEVERYADHVLSIPESHPWTAPVLASVQLQLLAYHAADRLGRSIDKPRNLAKSVTVE